MSVFRSARALDSPWTFAACAVALAALGASHGCSDPAGPCGGQACPLLPGCETENIACDPDHVCTELVCEGQAWICGRDEKESYSWVRSAAPCTDGDPCTTGDTCVVGKCTGTALSCSTPPLAACEGTGALKTWSAGRCEGGQCVYPMKSEPCPANDCLNGQCQSDPCRGKSCDLAPDGSPCYELPGKCADGTCTFTPLASGTACQLADRCMQSPACDGNGKCVGTPLSCKNLDLHIAGGTCVQGVCQALQCVAPWKNCDGDIKNGCEIPEGQPNSCTINGLATRTDKPGSACGTPWCGSGKYPFNGGKAHCAFCSHCVPNGSGWSWCLWPANDKYSTGIFDKVPCSSSCCSSAWMTAAKIKCASGAY